MVEILLFVCLPFSSGPLMCDTKVLPWEGSTISCMLHGQQVIAQWSEQHPIWEVKSYRCAVNNEREA